MLLLRQTDRLDLPAPWADLRMLAVAAAPGRLAMALSALGARVETETCLFEAVETLQHDPTGFAVAAVDCDGFGGLNGVRRLLPLLGRARERLALLLVASETVLPELAPPCGMPVVLRSPLGAGGLRAGLAHLLRDRMVVAPA